MENQNKEIQDKLLSNATGPVTIPMTNDYLFRALLQRNSKVLRGLLCSLLHMKEDEIKSVTITNPIILGDAFNEKEFFLDINLVLNDNSIINLEMQVINEHNWPERSLSYLCRNFDNLNRGRDYKEVKAAIQIGILDFTLFPEHPEFYSTYQLLNVNNFTKYSDKFGVHVLDLTQKHLATEEDKAYHIDHWAALFKATTWEEIRMLAQNDEYIKDASVTIRELTQEERIRLQCEAREDYYRRQRSYASWIAEKEAEFAEKEAEFAEKEAEFVKKEAMIAEQKAALADKDALIAELKAQLEAKGIPVEENS